LVKKKIKKIIVGQRGQIKKYCSGDRYRCGTCPRCNIFAFRVAMGYFVNLFSFEGLILI